MQMKMFLDLTANKILMALITVTALQIVSISNNTFTDYTFLTSGENVVNF